MQIREQGRRLQFIRTEYCDKKKRTFGKMFASQSRYLSTIDDSIRHLLTDDEVDQLENYLSKRAEKESVDSAKNSLSSVHRFIGRAAKALSVDTVASELSSDDADAIYAAMDELAKALRKRGHTRPARAKAKPADTQTVPLALAGENDV